MGLSFAKERTKMSVQTNDSTPLSGAMNLETNTQVDKIMIHGIGKTKNDLVIPIVKDLFLATNYGEVLARVESVSKRIEALDCFQNVGVFVDCSKSPDKCHDGVEVTFNVKELDWVTGRLDPVILDGEGTLNAIVCMPNILGGGEKLEASIGRGNRRSQDLMVSIFKPVERRGESVFRASYFQKNFHCPRSSFKQKENGFLFGVAFNTVPQIRHNLQYQATWRNLSPIGDDNDTPLEIRENFGHSLKSSVVLSTTLDRRNHSIFPTSGCLLSHIIEFAGLGGDSEFVKNEVKAQTNLNLFKDVVLQMNGQAGLINGLNNLRICDRLFLGGPNSIRGFQEKGVGPHYDGKALGAEAYWSAGLNLFSSLPFKLFGSKMGDLVRTHLFFNGGNISNLTIPEVPFEGELDLMSRLKNGMRLACGGGVAIKISPSVRLELNLSYTLSAQPCDVPKNGFQFGFGLNFL